MNEITLAIKEVLEFSSQLTTWALSVFAGTVATIIGTSYIRPKEIRFRLAHLLFFPGWICLAFSIFYGEQLTRKYLAAIMVPPGKIPQLASDINDLFGDQRLFFLMALVFFGAWLVVFLLQWVFVHSISEEEQR